MDEESMKRFEKTYNNIIKFYDFAEELVDSVEGEPNDPEGQLEFVEPIIEQIEEATDVLAEEYRHFVQSGKGQPDKVTKQKIEKALAQLYLAIHMCNEEDQGRIQ